MASGSAAQLAERASDVVVLDLRLPGMGGLEWLSSGQPSRPGAEVLMVTGFASVDTAVEAIQLGAFDYLVKPLKLAKFAERVSAAVERHRLRVQAGEGSDRYQTLVESLPVEVVETTRAGRVRFCNERAAAILGYERAEYEQLNEEELYVDSTDRQALHERLRDEGAYTFECPLRHRDGHTVWVRSTSRVVEREGDVVYLGVFEDITRERGLADALRRTEEAAARAADQVTSERRAERARVCLELDQVLRPGLERVREEVAWLVQHAPKGPTQWRKKLAHLEAASVRGLASLKAPRSAEDDAEEDVGRGAMATRVQVRVETVGGTLQVEVRDNGTGEVAPGGDQQGHAGEVRARALLRTCGGDLEVRRGERGTAVHIVMPLPWQESRGPAGPGKALLASACDLLRLALKQILGGAFGMRTGEVCTRRELRESAWGRRWDLIVVDMSLSGAQTAEVIREIREGQRETPIIAVAWGQRALRVRDLVEAGVSGCLAHGCGQEEWEQAVAQVLAGEKYVSGSLAGQLMPDAEEPHDKLTGREFEMLCGIGEGKSVKQIAEAVGRSEVTLRKARQRLLRKMSMKTNGELIRYALAHELVD